MAPLPVIGPLASALGVGSTNSGGLKSRGIAVSSKAPMNQPWTAVVSGHRTAATNHTTAAAPPPPPTNTSSSLRLPVSSPFSSLPTSNQSDVSTTVGDSLSQCYLPIGGVDHKDKPPGSRSHTESAHQSGGVTVSPIVSGPPHFLDDKSRQCKIPVITNDSMRDTNGYNTIGTSSVSESVPPVEYTRVISSRRTSDSFPVEVVKGNNKKCSGMNSYPIYSNEDEHVSKLIKSTLHYDSSYPVPYHNKSAIPLPVPPAPNSSDAHLILSNFHPPPPPPPPVSQITSPVLPYLSRHPADFSFPSFTPHILPHSRTLQPLPLVTDTTNGATTVLDSTVVEPTSTSVYCERRWADETTDRDSDEGDDGDSSSFQSTRDQLQYPSNVMKGHAIYRQPSPATIGGPVYSQDTSRRTHSYVLHSGKLQQYQGSIESTTTDEQDMYRHSSQTSHMNVPKETIQHHDHSMHHHGDGNHLFSHHTQPHHQRVLSINKDRKQGTNGRGRTSSHDYHMRAPPPPPSSRTFQHQRPLHKLSQNHTPCTNRSPSSGYYRSICPTTTVSSHSIDGYHREHVPLGTSHHTVMSSSIQVPSDEQSDWRTGGRPGPIDMSLKKDQFINPETLKPHHPTSQIQCPMNHSHDCGDNCHTTMISCTSPASSNHTTHNNTTSPFKHSQQLNQTDQKQPTSRRLYRHIQRPHSNHNRDDGHSTSTTRISDRSSCWREISSPCHLNDSQSNVQTNDKDICIVNNQNDQLQLHQSSLHYSIQQSQYECCGDGMKSSLEPHQSYNISASTTESRHTTTTTINESNPVIPNILSLTDNHEQSSNGQTFQTGKIQQHMMCISSQSVPIYPSHYPQHTTAIASSLRTKDIPCSSPYPFQTIQSQHPPTHFSSIAQSTIYPSYSPNNTSWQSASMSTNGLSSNTSTIPTPCPSLTTRCSTINNSHQDHGRTAFILRTPTSSIVSNSLPQSEQLLNTNYVSVCPIMTSNDTLQLSNGSNTRGQIQHTTLSESNESKIDTRGQNDSHLNNTTGYLHHETPSLMYSNSNQESLIQQQQQHISEPSYISTYPYHERQLSTNGTSHCNNMMVMMTNNDDLSTFQQTHYSNTNDNNNNNTFIYFPQTNSQQHQQIPIDIFPKTHHPSHTTTSTITNPNVHPKYYHDCQVVDNRGDNIKDTTTTTTTTTTTEPIQYDKNQSIQSSLLQFNSPLLHRKQTSSSSSSAYVNQTPSNFLLNKQSQFNSSPVLCSPMIRELPYPPNFKENVDQYNLTDRPRQSLSHSLQPETALHSLTQQDDTVQQPQVKSHTQLQQDQTIMPANNHHRRSSNKLSSIHIDYPNRIQLQSSEQQYTWRRRPTVLRKGYTNDSLTKRIDTSRDFSAAAAVIRGDNSFTAPQIITTQDDHDDHGLLSHPFLQTYDQTGIRYVHQLVQTNNTHNIKTLLPQHLNQPYSHINEGSTQRHKQRPNQLHDETLLHQSKKGNYNTIHHIPIESQSISLPTKRSLTRQSTIDSQDKQAHSIQHNKKGKRQVIGLSTTHHHQNDKLNQTILPANDETVIVDSLTHNVPHYLKEKNSNHVLRGVCRHFLLGRCTYPNCNFSHSSDPFLIKDSTRSIPTATPITTPITTPVTTAATTTNVTSASIKNNVKKLLATTLTSTTLSLSKQQQISEKKEFNKTNNHAITESMSSHSTMNTGKPIQCQSNNILNNLTHKKIVNNIQRDTHNPIESIAISPRTLSISPALVDPLLVTSSVKETDSKEIVVSTPEDTFTNNVIQQKIICTTTQVEETNTCVQETTIQQGSSFTDTTHPDIDQKKPKLRKKKRNRKKKLSKSPSLSRNDFEDRKEQDIGSIDILPTVTKEISVIPQIQHNAGSLKGRPNDKKNKKTSQPSKRPISSKIENEQNQSSQNQSLQNHSTQKPLSCHTEAFVSCKQTIVESEFKETLTMTPHDESDNKIKEHQRSIAAENSAKDKVAQARHFRSSIARTLNPISSTEQSRLTSLDKQQPLSISSCDVSPVKTHLLNNDTTLKQSHQVSSNSCTTASVEDKRHVCSSASLPESSIDSLTSLHKISLKDKSKQMRVSNSQGQLKKDFNRDAVMDHSLNPSSNVYMKRSQYGNKDTIKRTSIQYRGNNKKNETQKKSSSSGIDTKHSVTTIQTLPTELSLQHPSTIHKELNKTNQSCNKNVSNSSNQILQNNRNVPSKQTTKPILTDAPSDVSDLTASGKIIFHKGLLMNKTSYPLNDTGLAQGTITNKQRRYRPNVNKYTYTQRTEPRKTQDNNHIVAIGQNHQKNNLCEKRQNTK